MADSRMPFNGESTPTVETKRWRTLLRALNVRGAESQGPPEDALVALCEEIGNLRAHIKDLTGKLQKAETLADNDALCPVFNRRAFLRELSREISLCHRHKTSLSLLYLDLDHFKQVNDRFGHAVGDQILVDLAGHLTSSVRQSDIVGRLGGDEFAIALPRATYPDACSKATRLMSSIDSALWAGTATNGQGLKIGASCGVVTWNTRDNAERLLKQADADMYKVKVLRRQKGA